MEIGTTQFKKKQYLFNWFYGSLDLVIITYELKMICINVKVFEWNFLLSSAANMVTQIIYFGRMEGGDWYHTVVV